MHWKGWLWGSQCVVGWCGMQQGLGRLAALSRAVPRLEKLSLRKSRGGGPGLPATLADFTLVRKERDVSSVCSPRTDRGL